MAKRAFQRLQNRCRLPFHRFGLPSLPQVPEQTRVAHERCRRILVRWTQETNRALVQRFGLCMLSADMSELG